MYPVPRTILFLIRSLNRGGAERQLVVLAKGLVRRGHSIAVMVFFGGGVYETELVEAGVHVINLGKNGRWDIVPFLNRLVCLLRKERPAVLHSYLAVPNILAAVLKPLLRGTRIVWGVRASNMDLSRYDWLACFSYALERCLARFADLIIANSRAGATYAIQHGFPARRVVVIANGIDTERFRFDPQGRGRIRAGWQIREDALLIGLVARLDPMKDHAMFLQAASLLADKFPNLRFVCVGSGAPNYLENLKQMAASLDLGGRMIWTGARDDMPVVYSALDIAASSSFGEGFSNTVAEAMACGVPCVVTDVGDSALVVGNTGSVVAPGDPQALADALMHLIALPAEQRLTLGAHARDRIVAKFGVEALVTCTERILDLT